MGFAESFLFLFTFGVILRCQGAAREDDNASFSQLYKSAHSQTGRTQTDATSQSSSSTQSSVDEEIPTDPDMPELLGTPPDSPMNLMVGPRTDTVDTAEGPQSPMSRRSGWPVLPINPLLLQYLERTETTSMRRERRGIKISTDDVHHSVTE